MELDEQRIDEDYEAFTRVVRLPWTRSLPNTEALINRIRIALIAEDMPRHKRALYRSVIDYFEDVVEHRHAQEDKDRGETRRHVRGYLRSILQGLADNQDD
jgi:hypothetical protein